MSNEKFKVKFGLTVGESAATIDTSGNIVATGNLTAPALKSSSGTTAVTLSGADATIAGNLTLGGNTIKSSGGTTAITLSGADATVAGDFTVNGGDLTIANGAFIYSANDPAIQLVGSDVTVIGDLSINGDLTVQGDTVQLNVSQLNVEDNSVVLNSNVTGSPVLDASLEVERGSSVNSSIKWNETQDKWYQNRAGTDTVIAINTDELNEGSTNQYFTNARARQAVSVTDTGGDGSLSYDNSTGVITYTGPSATEVRAHFTGGTGVTITDGSIAIGQAVATTSDVTFNTAKTALSMATGGASLPSGIVNTFATFGTTGTVSGSTSTLGLRAENVTTGYGASNVIVDHGQNRPSGTATTSGSPLISFESTRGTSTTPTATGANDTLGVVSFSGHDGVRGLGTQVNGGSVQMIALAASAYTNDGTYTTNAGANLLVRSQPTNLRLTSNSRQALFFQNYTTVAGAPPTQNILWNSSSMTTQYDTAGTTINGHGKQAHTFYHPTFSIYGVPSQSTANVDNNNLLGTNTLSFYSSRQSGWSGRRDAVQSGDTLAQVNVFGQTGTDSTGNGSQTGTLQWTAAENFGASNRGSTFTLQTGVIGANTLTNRLSLDSNQNTLTSDKFQLQNNAGNAYLYADSGLTNLMSPTGHLNISGEFTHINTISTNSRGIVLQPGPDVPATGKYTEATFATNRNPGTASPDDYSSINFATYNTTDGVNYTPTQSGDYIGQFKFNGNANTSTSPGVPGGPTATIQVQATENWSGTGTGSKFIFAGIKNGSTNTTNVIEGSPSDFRIFSDELYFNSSTGSPLNGNKIAYARNYAEFSYTGGNITPAAANTIYAFPLDTTHDASGTISTSNTSRVEINTAGRFKLITSIQVKNNSNSNDYTMRFWLRKNGSDVANSATLITPLKLQEQVVAMDWLVESDGNDYFEIVYYVSNTSVTFPYYAAGTSPVTYPAAPPIILNVIPIGA